MNWRAKAYILTIGAAGAWAIFSGGHEWTHADPTKFITYWAGALVASGLKLALPRINGTLSINFLFILAGVVELSLAETVTITITSMLAQYFWNAQEKLLGVKVIFNLASAVLAVTAAYRVFHWNVFRGLGVEFPILLALSALTYFFCNTGCVAIVAARAEGKRLDRLYHEFYFRPFPYYLLGAAAVGVTHLANQYTGWQTTLLILPAIALVYLGYRAYLHKPDAETEEAQPRKSHAEEMASLHLRAIEALALAIQAKDNTTHDHLQRVQVYALEIAKDMGLPSSEIEALRAASLPHDIGKLAVPEHMTGADIRSLSIGKSELGIDGTAAEELRAEADKRMYAAKRAFHLKVREIRPPAIAVA